MEKIYCIVGLGNPGAKYENTRHNLGFLVLDWISSRYNIKMNKVKHKALIGDGTIEGSRVLLVKPQTFMNLSGESVREIIEWFKIPVEQVILVYDDIDLPLGKVRIRPNGGAGTHNGMKSVIYQIQSNTFPRVRVGAGTKPEGWDLADFVLSRIGEPERKIADDAIKIAGEASVKIIKSGITAAMNEYNPLANVKEI